MAATGITPYEPHNSAEMGIAVEGMEAAWPSPGDYQLGQSDPLRQQHRTIEVFNKGKESFTATAKVSAPWIILNHTSVQVETEAQLIPKAAVSSGWKVSSPQVGH